MKFYELWADKNLNQVRNSNKFELSLDRFVKLTFIVTSRKDEIVNLCVEDLYDQNTRDETSTKEPVYNYALGIVSVSDLHEAINMVEDVYEECFETFCSLLKLEVKS